MKLPIIIEYPQRIMRDFTGPYETFAYGSYDKVFDYLDYY